VLFVNSTGLFFISARQGLAIMQDIIETVQARSCLAWDFKWLLF